jgi:hypothetical protein
LHALSKNLLQSRLPSKSSPFQRLASNSLHQQNFRLKKTLPSFGQETPKKNDFSQVFFADGFAFSLNRSAEAHP